MWRGGEHWQHACSTEVAESKPPGKDDTQQSPEGDGALE